jgi:hypothetical protein
MFPDVQENQRCSYYPVAHGNNAGKWGGKTQGKMMVSDWKLLMKDSEPEKEQIEFPAFQIETFLEA